jgi:hypothetical protein
VTPTWRGQLDLGIVLAEGSDLVGGVDSRHRNHLQRGRTSTRALSPRIGPRQGVRLSGGARRVSAGRLLQGLLAVIQRISSPDISGSAAAAAAVSSALLRRQPRTGVYEAGKKAVVPPLFPAAATSSTSPLQRPGAGQGRQVATWRAEQPQLARPGWLASSGPPQDHLAPWGCYPGQRPLAALRPSQRAPHPSTPHTWRRA